MTVGSFQPNALGLFDMHGNVCEWCADDKRTYQERKVKDPVGNKHSDGRVIRGGSWRDHRGNCRAASRSRYYAGYRGPEVGFRVCLSAKAP
jgi:formylglycine-generating enzyme required for sulfatase activity